MKNSKKHRFLFFCFLLFLLGFLVIFTDIVYAEEGEGSGYTYGKVPGEYTELVEGLPSDISSALPEGVYSDEPERLGSAVAQMFSAEYLFSAISSAINFGLGDAVALFVMLSGVLVLSAVFSAFKSSVASEAMSRAVSFATSCALFGCVISLQAEHFLRVEEFFDRLALIMNGMIPVATVVYAMGGNLSTAAASSGTFYIFLAFCEEVCRTSILPIAALCTAFALCSSFSSSINLHGLSSAIKKCYTFVLGFMMTVLLAVLSAQTLLSSAADTVSARAAKLVASNVIPIVGSSVGDTLRTLSSSVGYLKSVCGIGGIIFIVLLVLPTLVSLLLTRAVFILAVAVADLVGCESESKLLSELGSVYGMLVAVISMCSVMFILALTVFVRCTVALG